MDPDVVRVGVLGLVVAVGDDDLGPLAADHLDQPPDRLVERGLGERVRPGVGLGVGHARVSVAQQDRLVVSDDVRGRLELGHADPADVGPDLRRVHGRVQDVALLAPGAAHEDRADALGVVAGDGRRPLGRLVVGVRMDAEQAEAFGHRRDLTGGDRPARPDHARPGPPLPRWALCS